MAALINNLINMNPVVHFEMPAEDMERMKKFYSGTFGWKMMDMGEQYGGYIVAQTDETDAQGMLKQTNRINGGFYKKGKDGTIPHVVIAVDDIKSKVDEVKNAGGNVEGEPQNIPGIGDFVMFTDTEGNRVGMLQPKTQM